jgi:hypothetical protein
MFDKLNLLKSKSLSDITAFGTYKNDVFEHVTDFFGSDDVTYAHLWPYAPFNYTINNNGFRGAAFPTETDIAAFGCSFTFGSGLPEYMLWNKVLSDELGKTSVNFGVPSASIESIVDIFLIASTHIKMKSAVFLFPHHTRMQIAKKHPVNDRVDYLNTDVKCASVINKAYGLEPEYFYRGIPEEEMYKSCKNKIYLLEHIAKERGIDLYVSSWSADTYNLLNELEFESAILLPEWSSPSMEFADADKARDNKHPGPKHHVLWVDKIKSYIK